MTDFPVEILLFITLWIWLRLRKPELGARAGTWLLFASLGSVCLRYGILTLAMVFRTYDDEGYVLYSIYNHLAGGALYDEVQSLYGPFPFLVARLQQWIGLSPTHDHGRLITLAYWILLAAGTSGLSFKLTRSKVAAAVCLCVTTVYLKVLANEPSHPVALITVFAMAAAWLFPGNERGLKLKGLFLGALAAALLMSKFNTGIFLISACGIWWLWRQKQSGSSGRLAYLSGTVILVAMPLVLMKSFLGFEGVGLHMAVSCLVFIGALATSFGDSPQAGRSLGLGLSWLLGLLVGVLAITAYTLATGTSLKGLLDGVVLFHLRNLTFYHVPVPWLPGTAIFTLVCAALCVCSRRMSPAWRFLAATVPSAIALLGILLAWSNILPIRMEAMVLSLGLPASCTVLIKTEKERHDRSLLLWIFLIGATQALHTFPVAGTHLACGTLLLLPLLCLRCHDLISSLPALQQGSRARLLLSGSILAGVVLCLCNHLNEEIQWYKTRRPLDLPGARSLQLRPALAASLRVLTNNARIHGTQVYSEPGQFSFNLWSGIPTPTRQNVTHWFKLLSQDSMDAIAQSLCENKQAVVIRESLNKDAALGSGHPSTSLERCIQTEFKTLFTLGTYSFLVRNSSQAIALDIMTVQGLPDTQAIILEFVHPFSETGEVFGLAELVQLTPIGTDIPVLETKPLGTLVELTPVRPDGSESGGSGVHKIPFRAAGLQRVRIHLSNTRPPPANLPLMLVLKDPLGGVLGYVQAREPTAATP